MKATTKKEIDPQELRKAITFMDLMAQAALSEIKALASMAMTTLETPAGYSNIDHIFYTLSAIANKAEDMENCINSTAEDVGCNYKDDAFSRRMDARLEADSIRFGGRGES